MSYAVWSDFAYYVVNDIVSYSNSGINYICIANNIDQIPPLSPGFWTVLPPPGGAGVDSLSGLTGAITQSCVGGSYATVGNNIELTITGIPIVPQTLSLVGDDILLSGGGGSVAVGSASSVSSNTGKLTAQSYSSLLLTTNFTSDVVVGEILNPRTMVVNGTVVPKYIQDAGGLDGTNGQVLSIDSSGLLLWSSALVFEGIQNKLGIIPALPHTSDTTALAANNDLTPPTAIVPDATAPTSSTTPEGTACWLYTKPVGNAGFNWYMYNPRFSSPAAPLPYKKYSSNPAQERIQSVWALVQPAVNTNIYTPGIIALNLYSFDDTNPPTSGFFNTRWAYSNSAGINSGQSGTNLYAGYTYLLYAYDAPRITNQTGVGQPDIQDWGLRDPYDLYTDIHHIPLQNCVIAFNPDASTNFISWTSATAFLTGQTCVYSGFGGTPNGIFYTAVQNSTNQLPVSATGVPNTAFWTAISPQPSAYASQPILAMNVNGISGTAAGWTAGPLLRVLSMGYTTGNNPYTQTSGVRYVLN